MAGYVTEIILLFLVGFFAFRGLPGVIGLIRVGSWRRVSGSIIGAGVAGYQTQAGPGHLGAGMQRSAVAYGQQVDVRVDPANPTNSVLHSSSRSSAVFTATGVVLLVAGAVSLLG